MPMFCASMNAEGIGARSKLRYLHAGKGQWIEKKVLGTDGAIIQKLGRAICHLNEFLR